MEQLTEKEAIQFHNSKLWEDMSAHEKVSLQLFQELLCMPFDVFHEAIEECLGRPVFTHEFAYIEMLRQEFLGEKESPTLEGIINLIPEEKRLLVWHP